MNYKKIPYAQPYITEEDVEAVTTAVREKRLSQGVYVDRFEKEFANHLGCKHAIAATNGTAALHLAVAAIGIGPGDEVIVPSFTFVATANVALYMGAKPVFVDIDPRTYNINPAEIERAVSAKSKAIIVVHYGGQTADMDPILEIANKHGLRVIEDASEAHGATYKDRKAGSMADLGTFSFYPNKNMTTGEGGMLVTNDEELAERARLLRSQGQDSRYHHIMLGYNYKMTDIQAALGISQLKRLSWVIERKKEAAQYYENLLKGVEEVTSPHVMPDCVHGYMFYTVSLPLGLRDKVAGHLNEVGVETVIAFSPPVHLQPFYISLYGYKEGYLPTTEECSRKVLSLPMYPHIRREDQDFVVESIKGGLRK